MPELTAEELKRCYELLDLQPGASAHDLKESYRDLIRIWHPDRYHGEPERVRRRAEDKFRELTEAYQLLQGLVDSGSESRELILHSETASIDSAGTGARVISGANLRPVRFGTLYGYVEANGRLAITPRFEFADNFFEDLARVQERGMYGFINAAGEYVISAIFEAAGKFAEGLAPVRFAHRYGYVNSTGHVVVTPQFESAANFHDGLAVVGLNGRLGYINPQGRMVIPALYDAAETFSNGRARARLGDKWGRLNRQGEFYLDSR